MFVITIVALVLISAQLSTIRRKLKHMTTIVEDLKAAEAEEAAKIDSLLAYAAQQQTHIAELEAQIAALPGDTSGIQAVIAEMKAKSALISGVLPPPSAPGTAG